MTELASPPPAQMRRAPMQTWPLTVVDAFSVTPRMRRVRLVGETMDDFTWKAGQDLVLSIPVPGGETVRRHYTIRSYDPSEQRLEIDFVLHGEGPAARWAERCELGDEIVAAGPRGRTVLREGADWRLFVGDETCLPGIAAMLEALPPGARATAIIEVWDKDERLTPPSRANVEIEWFHRNGPARAASALLIDRLALFAPPPGIGHAYVIGETSTVRAIRQGLIAKGFPRDRIAAEGYWRPGRVGGHDHVFDAQDIPGEVIRRLVR
jgi:NADPH-dependent ferric siderophore reductase